MNVAQKIKLPAFAMGQRSKSPTHKRRSRRAKGKYIRTVWSCRHHGINYLPIRAPTCERHDKMEWKVPVLPDKLVIFKREQESSLGSWHFVFYVTSQGKPACFTLGNFYSRQSGTKAKAHSGPALVIVFTWKLGQCAYDICV